jgi:tetratricopeptide (TPR) repeat protein
LKRPLDPDNEYSRKLMLVSFLTVLLVTAAPQSLSTDRTRAEQLARAGQNAAAHQLFEQLVHQDPTDTESRLWIARLDLRMGQTDDAERGFRSVLRDQPADIDAAIGLASALLRKGASAEALAILTDVESAAGENADLLSALGRAYRRNGDDRRAFEYFTRARALAPSDPDVASGYEAVALSYGHSLLFEGFAARDSSDEHTSSGTLTTSIRAAPRVHLDGTVRLQHRVDVSDTLGGGGFLWRVTRAANVGVHALAGPGNTVLPTSDVAAEVISYTGVQEFGGGVRRLSFSGVKMMALSPLYAWDAERTRLDVRYTYSRLRFGAEYADARDQSASTQESTGDHSIFLRETWRYARRSSLHVVYAYGIESFEDVTADRIGSLGATTLAIGGTFTAPSLTRMTATWEHQRRSNTSTLDRVTVSIVQIFR